jgi:sugar phosphate isomerase/epimerase
MREASVFTDEISQDFADAVRTAAAAGLHYVDVRRAWGVFSHELPRTKWKEMAAILDENGLRTGAIQSNFGKCPLEGEGYEEHMRFLPVLVEQAHFFGTRVIRTFPFWQTDRSRAGAYPHRMRPNLPAMLPTIVRQFRPAARLAEQEGIVLALEPEHSTFSGSPAEVRAIIDALESPAVKVAWDVSNGWPDEPIFPDTYERFRGLVANVHVKERAFAPGDPAGEGRRLPVLLGTGVLPWPEVIERLEADGYEGVYTIETHFGNRGPYGWPKLKAATSWYMYALRELLEAPERGSRGNEGERGGTKGNEGEL